MSGVGNMANQLVDATIQGSTVAATYKVLFTKKRGFGQIFSMDTLMEGAKLAASIFIYNVAGRPIVRAGQNAVGGAVAGNV